MEYVTLTTRSAPMAAVKDFGVHYAKIHVLKIAKIGHVIESMERVESVTWGSMATNVNLLVAVSVKIKTVTKKMACVSTGA